MGILMHFTRWLGLMLLVAGCKGAATQGPPGETGPMGLAGPQGTPGLQGPQGVAGPQGATGPAGPAGAAGADGAMGPMGPMGVPGATGPQGVQGPSGNQGLAGADGDLRIYGDGSAGSRTLTVDEDWTFGQPVTNLQFQNFTINSGVTLTLPSGVVIRVAGAFQNNGTIRVRTWGGAGLSEFTDEPVSGGGAQVLVLSRVREAGLGIAASRAGGGQYTRISYAVGGFGGSAIRDRMSARMLTRPGHQAGGGGGGTFLGQGGEGGGSLTIIARGTLTNNGLIEARGGNTMSGGGGGGGVVVLASRTSISQSGSPAIAVTGGNGGNASPGICAGGGAGGGGFVHFLAPIVTGPASFNVSAGIPGIGNSLLAGHTISGGGGGGASAGSGGQGGTATTSTPLPAGGAGGLGFVLTSTVDPGPLF